VTIQESRLLRWNGKDHDLPQDFADMQVKELAMKVDQVYDSFPDKDRCSYFVITTDKPVRLITTRDRPCSRDEECGYIDWFPLDHDI